MRTRRVRRRRSALDADEDDVRRRPRSAAMLTASPAARASRELAVRVRWRDDHSRLACGRLDLRARVPRGALAAQVLRVVPHRPGVVLGAGGRHVRTDGRELYPDDEREDEPDADEQHHRAKRRDATRGGRPGAAGTRRRRGGTTAGFSSRPCTARRRGDNTHDQPPTRSATRNRAEAERGFAAISSSPGRTTRGVRTRSSGSRPQPQTGRSGGQMQSRAASRKAFLTRRSSSE